MEKEADYPFHPNPSCLLSIGRQCDIRRSEAKFWGNGIRSDNPHLLVRSRCTSGTGREEKHNRYKIVLSCVGMRGRRLEEAVLVFRMTRTPNAVFLLPLTCVAWERIEVLARGLQECTQIPDR
jgi:hypothetical protein